MLFRPLTHQNALRIIIGIFGIMSICMALTNPLGEAPDEPAHMDYVRFLVQTQRLPIQCASPCISEVPGEGHQPPLAYALAASVTWPWIVSDHSWQTPAANPDFVWQGGTSPQAYIHGTQEHWPWQGIALAWRVARVLSVLWVIIGLWVVSHIARHLTNPTTAVLVVALLGSTPQLAFIASTVSNDALLFCLTSISMLLALRVERLRGFAVLSGSMALALLTKQNAIILVPILAAVVWFRFRGWSRLSAAGIGAGIFIGILGWWYLRNYTLYGDPLGYVLFSETYRTNAVDLSFGTTWATLWQQLMRTSWGVFGWNTIALPPWWYLIGASLSVLALMSAGIRLLSAPLPQPLWLGAGYIVGASFVWLLSLGLTVGTVAWQSRLIIMAVPVFALISGRALTWVFPMLTVRTIVLMHVVLVLTSAWLWYTHVLPAMPLQMPAAIETAQSLRQPDGAFYTVKGSPGHIIVVDRTHQESVRIGDTQTVVIRWQVIERPYRQWLVSFRWRDSNKQILAESQFPVHPNINSLYFTAGDRFIETYHIPVPNDLPIGDYTLMMSLIDAPSQQRAILRLADERYMGDSIFLPVTILSPTPLP